MSTTHPNPDEFRQRQIRTACEKVIAKVLARQNHTWRMYGGGFDKDIRVFHILHLENSMRDALIDEVLK